MTGAGGVYALVFSASGWYTGMRQVRALEITLYYNDGAVAVCRKPAGVDSESELPALLRAGLGTAEVFCVHRLDRGVGGVMVYALTREAAASLSEQMRAGLFRKEYLAVAHGAFGETEGTLRDLLFHDRAKNKSYVVTRRRGGVKEAALDYRVLGEAEGLSLLRIRLHTGRSHQIRVQLGSRRHPLVGDAKYGSPARECPIALFSCALSFTHPGSGRALTFSAPPPETYPWDRFKPCHSERNEESPGSRI